MIEIATLLKEVSKVSMNETSFSEIDKKMSPIELLKKSESGGLSGKFEEITKMKFEISKIEISRSFLPKEGGNWTGESGNSTWLPNRDEIPKRPPDNEKTWGEILDQYEIEGVDFKDGEPDFTTTSEGTVEIEDFTEDRNVNFTQADEKLAEQWTAEGKDSKEWTAQDIKEYRKENNLSWHERSDMKTLDLTPQEVHGNIPHSGGISALKNSQNSDAGKEV